MIIFKNGNNNGDKDVENYNFGQWSLEISMNFVFISFNVIIVSD